ncbi:FAD-binding domain-containing protein 15 [Elsinoe fawcettii]|nr:FAD-binding domain-containing protein 15 [Elsinoe fawcettii]
MDPIVIIGAGPVGLFTGLLLAQNGIKVTIYDQAGRLSELPRALAYFPVVLEEFGKAGILEEVIDLGHCNYSGADWRDRNGVLGSLSPPKRILTSVQLGQSEVSRIIYEHLIATGNGTVLFDHEFEGAEEANNTIIVNLRYQSRLVQHVARYLVGTDGGRSSVRKWMGQSLEGWTWDQELIAANVKYDLDQFGWKSANFIVDSDHWAVVAKFQKGNFWRIATASPRLTSEEQSSQEILIAKVRETARIMLPGKVEDIEYLQVSPYTIHQRCVSTFWSGRTLLAGDAAHLTNPCGGLGLLTGFLDAAALARALIQVVDKAADDHLVFSEYANDRRAKFLEITSPTATKNLNRLRSNEPADVAERSTFFQRMNDPADVQFKIDLAMSDFAISSTHESH